MRLRNILSYLEYHSAHQGDKAAFIYLEQGEHEAERISFAQLQQQSYTLGVALAGTFERSSRVLIALPDGIDFIRAFLGALYAGLIPVPAKPALNSESTAKLIRIAEDSQAQGIFMLPGPLEAQTPELSHALGRMQLLASEALISTVPSSQCAGIEGKSSCGSELAFLQYTSGSTGHPKGVMVSHDNLLANESMMSWAWATTTDDVIVSWLPMFHDMGLMGSVLLTVFSGAQCVLMKPAAFVQRPARWLEAVQTYGGTITGGPNFAYKMLATERVTRSFEHLNLSSLKVVYCGSEPISAAVVQKFLKAYERFGLRAETFSPSYGMAEATLMVSGGMMSNGYSSMAMDAVTGMALPGENPEAATPGIKQVIACGVSMPDQQLRIVNPHTRRLCADHETGEIWVAGPHIALGYWNNPEASEDTFGAVIEDEPPQRYLRTGDMGFLANGELYINGRIKELIIINGNNYYPQDIEETCSASHPALGPRAAAFGVNSHSGEEIVVILELSKSMQDELTSGHLDEITSNIRSSVYRKHSLPLKEIIYVRSNGIPQTTSGKICRVSCRRNYEARSLAAIGLTAVEE
ncbi:fatty acyl-AMP ligase [Pseudomonas japonica]|uniref:fatty acyl-AMP ligase n=1 Tax=Pseudomonas japonica TaxID=256466 RepID=UPI00380F8F27